MASAERIIPGTFSKVPGGYEQKVDERTKIFVPDMCAASFIPETGELHGHAPDYDALETAKAPAVQADKLGRAGDCRTEIDFVLAREKDCSVALNALREGKLPLRVTHNDTKLNNVLMDEATGEGMCIIDLDTVMPGLVLYDFGDSIRFGANHSAEDETDLSKVNLDLDLFAAYTAAFLEGAGGSLTGEEIACLPWGAKLMTLECGMRFLTDYLQGDTYFHISREKHIQVVCCNGM